MNEVKQIGNYRQGGTWDNPQTGRVYSTDGISPTLNTCGGGDREVKIIEQISCKLDKMPDGHLTSLNNAKVCDIGTPTASTITARYYKGIGAHKDNMVMEKFIVASRGRNPHNPSDRTPGNDVEQRLEPNSQGICNTLTSVQKDNLVLENVYDVYNNKMRDDKCCGTLTTNGNTSFRKCGTFAVIEEPTVKIKQATKDGYIDCKLGGVADLSCPTSKTRRGRVQDNGDTCPTLTASETGICRIETPYRLRKLTPLECWRLMDFTDEDFYKAKFVIEIEKKNNFIEQTEEKVNKILNSSLPESKKVHHIKNLSVKIKERTSNTQLYKQAGNSIVKAVLMAIFKQMM